MSGDNKPSLRQDVEMSEGCDKGPILQRIVDHVEQLDRRAEKSEKSQEKMTDALVSIAAQNERIISIADRTEHNHQDIQNLFKLNRASEERLTKHILSNGHTPKGQVDPSIKSKAKKFDAIQTSIYAGAGMGALAFIWKFIQTFIEPGG